MNNKELYVIHAYLDTNRGEILPHSSIVLNTKEEVQNWINNKKKNVVIRNIEKEIYLYESNEIMCTEKIDEKLAKLFLTFNTYDKEKIVSSLPSIKKKEVKEWISHYEGYKDIAIDYEIQEKFEFGEPDSKYYYKGYSRTHCRYCDYGKHDDNISQFISINKHKTTINIKLLLVFDAKEEFNISK